MSREKLKEVLCQYIPDTLTYIETVREFCDSQSKWSLQRETELKMMRDIKDRADKIDPKFKLKELGKYTKSKLKQMTADRRRELEKELGAVLKDTLGGLEKLVHFLDAVEKLAVTSLLVFAEESPFSHLCQSPENIQAIIIAARQVCPLLIHFKRDAGSFFLPSLFNVQVLDYQLDRYISITRQLCDRMETSNISQLVFSRKTTDDPEVDFGANVNDESMLNMLDHLNQLSDNRMNQHLRLVFLFQEGAMDYIRLFSERQPRMLQFLTELEERAVNLDKMKMGSQISSVAGSSVGVTAGALTIAGLALAPVTAGVSLTLTMTGIGLGVTSGVNSVVTSVTEIAVNSTNQKKASKVFQSFTKDVQGLQECLEQVSIERFGIVGEVLAVGNLVCKAITINKAIDSLVDAASARRVLKSKEVISSAQKLALQEGKSVRNMSSLASDIPDMGNLAKGTPLALSKSARAGFITLNALFIGLDVIFICKDSINLAKGSKSGLSQHIRARAALWSSEMDSWQKIHDSLCEGLKTSEESQSILEMPIYPTVCCGYIPSPAQGGVPLTYFLGQARGQIHYCPCKGLLTSEESQSIPEMPIYPKESCGFTPSPVLEGVDLASSLGWPPHTLLWTLLVLFLCVVSMW